MKTISTFDGVTLVSRNEYDDGAVLHHTLTVAPIETAHYWCCWNGQAQASQRHASGLEAMDGEMDEAHGKRERVLNKIPKQITI